MVSSFFTYSLETKILQYHFFLVLSTQSFKNGKNGAGNITILSKSILDTKSHDLSVSLQTHMVKGKTDPS